MTIENVIERMVTRYPSITKTAEFKEEIQNDVLLGQSDVTVTELEDQRLMIRYQVPALSKTVTVSIDMGTSLNINVSKIGVTEYGMWKEVMSYSFAPQDSTCEVKRTRKKGYFTVDDYDCLYYGFVETYSSKYDEEGYEVSRQEFRKATDRATYIKQLYLKDLVEQPFYYLDDVKFDLHPVKSDSVYRMFRYAPIVSHGYGDNRFIAYKDLRNGIELYFPWFYDDEKRIITSPFVADKDLCAYPCERVTEYLKDTKGAKRETHNKEAYYDYVAKCEKTNIALKKMMLED